MTNPAAVRFIDLVKINIISKRQTTDSLLGIDKLDQLKHAVEKYLVEAGLVLGSDHLLQDILSQIPRDQQSRLTSVSWARVFDTVSSLNEAALQQLEDSSEEEDPEETEHADTDEGGDGESDDDGKISELAEKLSNSFSYIPQIKQTLRKALDSNNVIAKPYRYTVNFYQNLVIVAGKVRARVKEISEILGISGVFIALAKAMDRFWIVDLVVRIAGTLVVLVLGAIAFFITVLKWAQNPVDRFLRWGAKILGIKAPGDEEADY